MPLTAFVACSYGLLFATFTSHTPPLLSIPKVSPFVNSSALDLCTLVCCDDSNVMHYLMYTTDNMLVQCRWGEEAHMSLHEKAVVLMRARKWYEDAANVALRLSPRMSDDDVSTAWLMASLYRQQLFRNEW